MEALRKIVIATATFALAVGGRLLMALHTSAQWPAASTLIRRGDFVFVSPLGLSFVLSALLAATASVRSRGDRGGR